MPTKITWRIKGFEEIRRTPEVERLLQEHVDRILNIVGEAGYAGDVESGASRSRGYVVTTETETIIDNADHHTLLRALGGR